MTDPRKKLPGFVRVTRPYRDYLFERRCLTLHESTFNEMRKHKKSGETWDDYMRRVAGIPPRKKR